MFPNVYFICMKYRLQVFKQPCYLFQYSSKLVTGTTDAKIKIGLTENDDKEILWLLQMLTCGKRLSKIQAPP